MGRQHIRDGVVHVTQSKTGAMLSLPVHPAPAAIIDATPTNHLTFLVTEYGQPYTPAGFGNWFRKQCDAADLSLRCAAHGLRKAGATIAAENGATPHQLKAIFGWSTLKQPELYTKAVEQKRVAAESMGLLSRRQRAAKA
jgi:site-specific recombinase XerD